MSDIENPGKVIGIATAVIFGGAALLLAVWFAGQGSSPDPGYGAGTAQGLSLVDNPPQHEAQGHRSADIAAAQAVKQAVSRGFKDTVEVRVGAFDGKKAVVVGDDWLFIVAGRRVCGVNGLAISLLGDSPPCGTGDFDGVDAAASRSYRWGEL